MGFLGESAIFILTTFTLVCSPSRYFIKIKAQDIYIVVSHSCGDFLHWDGFYMLQRKRLNNQVISTFSQASNVVISNFLLIIKRQDTLWYSRKIHCRTNTYDQVTDCFGRHWLQTSEHFSLIVASFKPHLLNRARFWESKRILITATDLYL